MGWSRFTGATLWASRPQTQEGTLVMCRLLEDDGFGERRKTDHYDRADKHRTAPLLQR